MTAVAGVRVMVVDDHPIWREAVARDLSEAGAEVVATAGDGPEAVRRAAAARPQVVLLDLRLPSLSGIEVTRRLVGADPAVGVLRRGTGQPESDHRSCLDGGLERAPALSLQYSERHRRTTQHGQPDSVFDGFVVIE